MDFDDLSLSDSSQGKTLGFNFMVLYHLKHKNSVVQTAYFHLSNINRLFHLRTQQHVRALVTSLIDFCNSQ